LNAPWRDKEAENAETVPGDNDSPDFKEFVERGMQRRDLIKKIGQVVVYNLVTTAT
jgi:hypothetical protein